MDSSVDFGTYHHSTAEESRRLREQAEEVFSRLMLSVFAPAERLRIMDAGCGLGFLMYVAAKCFPNAFILGTDLFKHGSVSDLSLEKTRVNLQALGIESRTSLLRHDLTRPLPKDAPYDLVISNAVFHNLGRKRFTAYETIFAALKPNGFFVVGDLFPKNNEDLEFFRSRSTSIQEVHESSEGELPYKIMLLRKN